MSTSPIRPRRWEEVSRTPSGSLAYCRGIDCPLLSVYPLSLSDAALPVFYHLVAMDYCGLGMAKLDLGLSTHPRHKSNRPWLTEQLGIR